MIVTIAGSPGARKREIGRRLASELGMRFVEIPDVRRALAHDHEVSESELEAVGEHEFWTDQQVDDYLEELAASHENLIIASRFAFSLAPDSFKVFLARDPLVTAHRVTREGDDSYGDSIDEIVGAIEQRSVQDRDRGERYYDTDPHDPSNFDLVLDTSRFEDEHVVGLLSSALGAVKGRLSESEHI